MELRRVLTTGAAICAAAGILAGCGGRDGGTTSTGGAAQGSGGSDGSSVAASVQRDFVRVVDDVSPAVVQIQTGADLGSGVVFDGRGNIVTNDHVVGGARSFTVTLSDGRRYGATLVGRFTPGDLAVIRLQGATPKPARFANSSKLQVGQWALAIGNPLGLRSSVTQGVVSSVGRTVSEGNGVVISSAIQTSAPINPGNSGGALVDVTGAVIGIPTLAAVDPQLGAGVAPGIGFAIPANTATAIAKQLIDTGRVTRSGRAQLGVEVATNALGQGVIVAAVKPGGPADKAGIRPGDTIVSVDNRPTPTTDDLTTVLAMLHPGQKVPVTIVTRGGQRKTVTVTLGQLSGP